MQEVEASYLDALLRPALESRGYTVLFLRKVGGTEPGDAYRQIEGVAMAWRGAAEVSVSLSVSLWLARSVSLSSGLSLSPARARAPCFSGSDSLSLSLSLSL